jgi:hypothetical protein
MIEPIVVGVLVGLVAAFVAPHGGVFTTWQYWSVCVAGLVAYAAGHIGKLR